MTQSLSTTCTQYLLLVYYAEEGNQSDYIRVSLIVETKHDKKGEEHEKRYFLRCESADEKEETTARKSV